MQAMTAPEQPDPALRPAIAWIDTHAHVFDAGVAATSNPRYVPGYSARLADWLALLDSHGVTHGVLVQPSFLGTDNALLLAALAQHPQRLRGVAVADPASLSRGYLAELWAQGVRGLRLNAIGQPVDSSLQATNRLADALARCADGKAWHLELHHEAEALGACVAAAVPRLAGSGVGLVVDHFGRPGPRGVDCPGQLALRQAVQQLPVWVKCSAPYRCRPEGLAGVAQALWRDLGPEHLLWGSDWPWTQHEGGRRYADAQASVLTLMPHAQSAHSAWQDSALRLFFAT
jgi:predicted TIM-barrel fold metal-dependent hydrolase